MPYVTPPLRDVFLCIDTSCKLGVYYVHLYKKVGVIMAREVKRVNMNIPVETLQRVDEYAEKMTISRTAAVLVLLNLALDSQKAMNDMSELLRLVQEENSKQIDSLNQ